MTLKELITEYLGVITAIRDYKEQGEPVPEHLQSERRVLGAVIHRVTRILEERKQK